MTALANERPDRDLIIQFSDQSAYNPRILKEVDTACEIFGSRLEVRFYGHYGAEFDCSTLRSLPSVQSLLLDCLTSVKNLAYVGDLDKLESFTFGAFESKSPRFLVFPNMRKLRRLVLGDTRKHDIDLEALSHCEALREVTIVGHHKNIAVLEARRQIEALRLVSMPKAISLGFVSGMGGLRRLSIGFGGRQTIEEIQHGAIESLALLRIRGLSHVTPGAFPSLTNLEIEDQIQLVAIDVTGVPRLRRLRIINCRGLVNLEGVESLRELKELRLGRTSLDAERLLSRRLPGHIESLHIWGYGAKRDKQIDVTLKSEGYASE